MTRFLNVEGKGPCVEVVFPGRKEVHIQSLIVSTCPKCGGYMQTIPVPRVVTELVGAIGKWRCISCGYIPELNTYDKEGATRDQSYAFLDQPIL